MTRWHIETEPEGHPAIWEDDMKIADMVEGSTCGDKDDAEVIAYAEQIVADHHAVPVLIEALDAMLEAYAPKRDFRTPNEWHGAVQKAQAALALARGMKG